MRSLVRVRAERRATSRCFRTLRLTCIFLLADLDRTSMMSRGSGTSRRRLIN